ncbi:MAG: delta-aminolevulinic acid dehydratase [Pelagibacteraceae bacterium]|jgi:porphobilinogen synthase|uniref:delta-aminolevulinic acid dehydratase n=1 Tax=Candidatus Pelagibacter sp. HIMB109 TaxID=3415412 RepID=UPI0031222A7C
MKNFFNSNKLKASNLIQPIFIEEGLKSKKVIKGLGVNYSHTIQSAKKTISSDIKKGVKNFIFFIVPKTKQKKPEDFNFHYQSLSQIKKTFGKRIVMIVDTCLCSVTTDGHCGITHKNKINLKETHKSLGIAADTFIQAGADIIAPSDMMKGTTRYLRSLFKKKKFKTPIMSYSSKFFSSFYGPFRNAAKSSPKKFDRSSYQLPVHDRKKAIQSSLMNAKQGASFLMVKPGITSIDLIREIKNKTKLPTGAYQVSGEYASLQYLAKNKLGDFSKLYKESLLAIHRAGADFIITYGARDIAKDL